MATTVGSLHNFMAENREELLSMCIRHMKSASPQRSDEELVADHRIIIDAIVRILAENTGSAEVSPDSRMTAAATSYGSKRQRSGDRIEQLATDFGAISSSMGQLAATHGLSFEAREYAVFNHCLDSVIASAIEQFWSQAQEQQEAQAIARLGFLAHELRNALSSARMSLAILKQGAIALNSRTGFILDRSLVRLQGLIDQTLMEVQLQARIEPQAKPIRVAELLHELDDAALPERDIRVLVEAEDALVVYADERLMLSALSNLLQNAVKFTRSGGQVVLRARRDQTHATIEVEDECGGLPPGKPEELLQPYVQRSSDRRGLGLGLAITREVIEAQKAELSIRNLPGKGCVFSVRVPAAQPIDMDQARASRVSSE